MNSSSTGNVKMAASSSNQSSIEPTRRLVGATSNRVLLLAASSSPLTSLGANPTLVSLHPNHHQLQTQPQSTQMQRAQSTLVTSPAPSGGPVSTPLTSLPPLSSPSTLSDPSLNALSPGLICPIIQTSSTAAAATVSTLTKSKSGSDSSSKSVCAVPALATKSSVPTGSKRRRTQQFNHETTQSTQTMVSSDELLKTFGSNFFILKNFSQSANEQCSANNNSSLSATNSNPNTTSIASSINVASNSSANIIVTVPITSTNGKGGGAASLMHFSNNCSTNNRPKSSNSIGQTVTQSNQSNKCADNGIKSATNTKSSTPAKPRSRARVSKSNSQSKAATTAVSSSPASSNKPFGSSVQMSGTNNMADCWPSISSLNSSANCVSNNGSLSIATTATNHGSTNASIATAVSTTPALLFNNQNILSAVASSSGSSPTASTISPASTQAATNSNLRLLINGQNITALLASAASSATSTTLSETPPANLTSLTSLEPTAPCSSSSSSLTSGVASTSGTPVSGASVATSFAYPINLSNGSIGSATHSGSPSVAYLVNSNFGSHSAISSTAGTSTVFTLSSAFANNILNKNGSPLALLLVPGQSSRLASVVSAAANSSSPLPVTSYSTSSSSNSTIGLTSALINSNANCTNLLDSSNHQLTSSLFMTTNSNTSNSNTSHKTVQPKNEKIGKISNKQSTTTKGGEGNKAPNSKSKSPSSKARPATSKPKQESSKKNGKTGSKQTSVEKKTRSILDSASNNSLLYSKCSPKNSSSTFPDYDSSNSETKPIVSQIKSEPNPGTTTVVSINTSLDNCFKNIQTGQTTTKGSKSSRSKNRAEKKAIEQSLIKSESESCSSINLVATTSEMISTNPVRQTLNQSSNSLIDDLMGTERALISGADPNMNTAAVANLVYEFFDNEQSRGPNAMPLQRSYQRQEELNNLLFSTDPNVLENSVEMIRNGIILQNVANAAVNTLQSGQTLSNAIAIVNGNSHSSESNVSSYSNFENSDNSENIVYSSLWDFLASQIPETYMHSEFIYNLNSHRNDIFTDNRMDMPNMDLLSSLLDDENLNNREDFPINDINLVNHILSTIESELDESEPTETDSSSPPSLLNAVNQGVIDSNLSSSSSSEMSSNGISSNDQEPGLVYMNGTSPNLSNQVSISPQTLSPATTTTTAVVVARTNSTNSNSNNKMDQAKLNSSKYRSGHHHSSHFSHIGRTGLPAPPIAKKSPRSYSTPSAKSVPSTFVYKPLSVDFAAASTVASTVAATTSSSLNTSISQVSAIFSSGTKTVSRSPSSAASSTTSTTTTNNSLLKSILTAPIFYGTNSLIHSSSSSSHSSSSLSVSGASGSSTIHHHPKSHQINHNNNNQSNNRSSGITQPKSEPISTATSTSTTTASARPLVRVVRKPSHLVMDKAMQTDCSGSESLLLSQVFENMIKSEQAKQQQTQNSESQSGSAPNLELLSPSLSEIPQPQLSTESCGSTLARQQTATGVPSQAKKARKY